MTPQNTESLLPDRVAALLGHGTSGGLASRLLASRRLAARLDEVLQQRLGPLPALDAAQARALELDAQGWSLLQQRAGAVWHGNAIAMVVDGRELRALLAEIGEDLRGWALRGRPLAPVAGTVAVAEIAAAIPAAGAGCLAAWCAAQPDSVRARIELRLAADLPAAGGVDGGAVVGWLLSQPA